MFKKVYVEITNCCNLNCNFCHGSKRKKEFISIENFNVLLDKLKGYTDYLYFHVMGEPLLHPFINDLLDIAYIKGFYVNITTNGYYIKKIINNKNIRQINISLHSFDDHNGKSLDEYLNDIIETVDKLKVNNTYVSYRMWVNNKYKESIIEKLEKKYGVNIGNNNHVKLEKNIYFEEDEEFIWPDLNNEYYEEVGSCLGCRSHIGILVDGTVVPCCLDSEGIINLGNIYKQDLNDIINSSFFRELKKGFLNNKKVHELCRKCNFYSIKKN